MDTPVQSTIARLFSILMVPLLVVSMTACDSGGSNSDSGGDSGSTDGTVVTDDITSNTTWSSDKTYVLDGLVFVENGATLTIEPGTAIKGRQKSEISTSDGASALIIKKSGKIDASGSPDNPIIFTSTSDDLSDPSDLGPNIRGLWGGLVLLGSAPNAENTAIQIEGIPQSTESAQFGSSNPDPTDNSGTLEYVSIRHGGFSISGVSGDEINGLTLGSIGSGTTISHVEVFANKDDGIEWFGGNVHADHLVAAFCGDDSFDWDTGFRGTGQYWFAVQATDAAGRGGEFDGYDSDTQNGEYSDPVLSNVTFIGPGKNASTGDEAIRIRNGGGGEIYNSIFTSYPDQALRIDADDGADTRWSNGDIVIRSNAFFDFGAGSDIPSIVKGTSRDSKIASNNSFTDPQLGGIDRGRNGNLDPKPSSSPISAESKSNFDNTNGTDSDYMGVNITPIQDTGYVGAFDPGASSLWTTGWTKLSQNGYLVE